MELKYRADKNMSNTDMVKFMQDGPDHQVAAING